MKNNLDISPTIQVFSGLILYAYFLGEYVANLTNQNFAVRISCLSATIFFKRFFLKIENLTILLKYNKTMKRGYDYIGVGVGAVIINKQGQVFLSQRGPLSRNERGKWEFPGGSVEFGEKLADALQREILEEFGMLIEVGELLDVSDHILPEEGQHWVSPTFICKFVSGTPSIQEPGKSSQIGWFNLDQLPENLSKISQENLAHYQKNILKIAR